MQPLCFRHAVAGRVPHKVYDLGARPTHLVLGELDADRATAACSRATCIMCSICGNNLLSIAALSHAQTQAAISAWPGLAWPGLAISAWPGTVQPDLNVLKDRKASF